MTGNWNDAITWVDSGTWDTGTVDTPVVGFSVVHGGGKRHVKMTGY